MARHHPSRKEPPPAPRVNWPMRLLVVLFGVWLGVYAVGVLGRAGEAPGQTFVGGILLVFAAMLVAAAFVPWARVMERLAGRGRKKVAGVWVRRR